MVYNGVNFLSQLLLRGRYLRPGVGHPRKSTEGNPEKYIENELVLGIHVQYFLICVDKIILFSFV